MTQNTINSFASCSSIAEANQPIAFGRTKRLLDLNCRNWSSLRRRRSIECLDYLIINTRLKREGRPRSGETKLIKDTLMAFYDRHYKATMSEKLHYRHMNTVLDHLSTDIITMYENNIKQHFVEYVERFVNVSWRKKELVTIIKKHKKTVRPQQEATNKLCRQLCRVKNDLLRPDQAKTSHTLYHAWIDEHRTKVMPTRQLRGDSIYYNI